MLIFLAVWMYISSGSYVGLLLQIIWNAKDDFMSSLNLSGIDEKANILWRGQMDQKVWRSLF